MLQFKQLLMKADELNKGSGASAYRIITILKKVYDDPEFRAECNLHGHTEMAAFLSKYCSNFGEYDLLYAILKKFPNEEQWKERTIPDMRKMLRENVVAQRKELEKVRDPKTGIVEGARVAPPSVARELAERSQIDQEAYKDLASQNAELLASNAVLKAENTKLREENRELLAENARLKRRLHYKKPKPARAAANV